MYRSDESSTLASDRAITLDHPHLQALETYWRSLQDADKIPARIDLNPARIEQVLPFAFILQRVAPGTARFRVAGQRIHDLLKMDPRGMPFSTLFEHDSHDELRALVEGTCASPAILGLTLRSPATLLRPEIDGALLLLPMRDSAGETTRLLGALVTPDHSQQKPRRFALRGDLPRRLDRLTDTSGGVSPLLHPAPAQMKRPDAGQRPALRLVVNNG